MNIAIFVIGLLVYGTAIRQDLYTRTISDTVSIVVCVLALCRWLFDHAIYDGLEALFLAAILFLALLFTFRRGWLGGGDVKLMTATVFLVGVGNFLTWFTLMALLGGVVSLIVVAWYWAQRLKRKVFTYPDAPATLGIVGELPKPTVPYGIAISLSALWVLFLQTGLKG